MVLNSLGTPLRKASFGSGRGGMMVVSIVFRKFTASSLIGMIVTRATSSSIQAGAPLLRAYSENAGFEQRRGHGKTAEIAQGRVPERQSRNPLPCGRPVSN